MGVRRLIWLLAALLLPAGCGGAGAAVRVEDAWARPALAGGPQPAANEMDMGAAPGTGAVFFTVVNRGRQPDRLLGATSDAAAAAEIHQTTMSGEVMAMRPVPGGIEIPAGGRVELKPGGYHLMLIGLRRDLAAGDRVTVTLQFEQAGAVIVEAEVRE